MNIKWKKKIEFSKNDENDEKKKLFNISINNYIKKNKKN